MREGLSHVGARNASDAFYRTPIFWLALTMLAASIGGCVVTIVLALGQPEGAFLNVGERLLSVPAVQAEHSQ